MSADVPAGTAPLQGMRIVSFCHYLQGPAAMQYLADMGAEIIKIEPPNGAFERHWGGADRARIGGVSAFFLCANRNVRSLAVDLKHPEAREVVMRLIESSHVVAENFRPGTLDRLGLGYDAVRQRKPDIIYASASGFGATGPYAKRPGQDLLIQAMSGLAAIGGSDGRPVPVGCAAVDQHGAALLALAISGAYCKLLTTGQGTRIESTLLNAAVDLQTESIVTYYASGVGRDRLKRDPRLGSWFHDAPYGIYRIRDGYLALSLNKVGAVGTALRSPEILAFSERNAYDERDAIARVVADAIKDRDFADLSQALDVEGIWHARVEDYDDLIHNPQVKANGGLESVDVNGVNVTLVSHPVTYDGVRPGFRSFALQPGCDTASVLEEAGYAPGEVAGLVRDGIVFAATEASA